MVNPGFPDGSDIKNPPTMRETWVQSLGWEDPLQEGTVTHSSILAWRIPWTEEPGRLQSLRSKHPQEQNVKIKTVIAQMMGLEHLYVLYF